MDNLVDFIAMEKHSDNLSPIENVIFETFTILSKSISHRRYKSRPDKIVLFFNNDLSNYHHNSYSSEALTLRIGKKKADYLRVKPKIMNNLTKFLDEIGCKTVNGNNALNRSQRRVDEEVSKIIRVEYEFKIAMLELEMAIVRSITKSNKITFTAWELSSRTGIKNCLKSPHLNLYLEKSGASNKSMLVSIILDKLLDKGHTVKNKRGHDYFKK